MVLDSSSLNKISLLFEGFLAMIVMSYVLDFIIIIIPIFMSRDTRARGGELERVRRAHVASSAQELRAIMGRNTRNNTHFCVFIT